MRSCWGIASHARTLSLRRCTLVPRLVGAGGIGAAVPAARAALPAAGPSARLSRAESARDHPVAGRRRRADDRVGGDPALSRDAPRGDAARRGRGRARLWRVSRLAPSRRGDADLSAHHRAALHRAGARRAPVATGRRRLHAMVPVASAAPHARAERRPRMAVRGALHDGRSVRRSWWPKRVRPARNRSTSSARA
jgi:hypothetical protein